MKPWILALVQNLRAGRHTPRTSAHQRTRLGVELLEDRAVPATFTVTTPLDDNVAHPGLMSLRQAIAAANNNNNPATVDVIRFAPGLNGATILLSNSLGELPVEQSVWVQGPGAPRLRVDGGGLSEEGGTRIFHVFSGDGPTRFTVTGLTLQNGDASVDFEEGNPQVEGGGAIEFNPIDFGDSVTVRNCIFRNNRTNGVGGAIHVWAAKLTIANCLFEGNSAFFAGGAVSYQGSGTLHISQSTFANNDAGEGGAGGALQMFFGAEGVINASTFRNNAAAGRGGAIMAQAAVKLTMQNCTVSGNVVSFGTGGGGIGLDSATLTLRNCTIAFNEVLNGAGGGIYANNSTVHINNTILDGNTVADGVGNDISRNVTSTINARFSLIRFAFIDNVLQVNGVNQRNIFGFSAGLLPLAFNGGPTQTHAITSLSKAFRKGSALLAIGLVYDQRGFPFFRVAGGFVDIGAFQTQFRRRNWGPGFAF